MVAWQACLAMCFEENVTSCYPFGSCSNKDLIYISWMHIYVVLAHALFYI